MADSLGIVCDSTLSVLYAGQDSVFSHAGLFADTLRTGLPDGGGGLPLLRLLRVTGLAGEEWLCGLMVVMLIAALFILALYKKQYLFQIRGLIAAPNSRKVVYDADTRGVWGTVLFWVIVIFSHTVFLTVALDRFAEGAVAARAGGVFGFMSLLFVLIAAYFAVKYLLIKAGGYVFDIRGRTAVFSDGYFMLIFIQGVILLPVSMAALYASPPVDNVFTVIGMAVIAVTEILVAVKGVQTFFAGWLSLLYIFLYLCTLEFLPVVLLVKALLTF